MERAAEAAREADDHYFAGLAPAELARLCTKTDGDGRTLLHSAVVGGNLELVRRLVAIESRSVVNAADEEVGPWSCRLPQPIIGRDDAGISSDVCCS